MKSGASPLTASLLARKGTAVPSRLFAVAPPPAAPRIAEPRIVEPRIVESRIVESRPTALAAAPSTALSRKHILKNRRRITLRLDPDQHMRLKLAGAHLGMSLQDIMIAALDAHLVREAPCPCLAEPK